MSSSDDSDAEQQRIDLLEQAARRNRLFLLGLSAALGSLMLGSVLFNLIHLLGDDSQATLQAQARQIASLEKQVQSQAQRLDEQQTLLASLQEARLQQVFSLAEHPDSIAQVAQVLQAQERDYRQALQALKRGMRDLANMLPGSRSWLSDYSEAIDQAQASSRKRASELQKWALESQNPLPSTPTPLIPVTPAATGKP